MHSLNGLKVACVSCLPVLSGVSGGGFMSSRQKSFNHSPGGVRRVETSNDTETERENGWCRNPCDLPHAGMNSPRYGSGRYKLPPYSRKDNSQPRQRQASPPRVGNQIKQIKRISYPLNPARGEQAVSSAANRLRSSNFLLLTD